MRPHELARLADVNPQTLRYYERIGLLPEPPRTSSGYRDYPDDAARRLRFIRRAKELGLHLDDIEELLDLDGHGRHRCDTARAVAAHRVTDLEQRIADLSRMRDALNGLVTRCSTGHDAECPVLDALDPS